MAVAAVEVERQYVRKSALCQFLDCGPSFVYALVRQGKLTPIRLSPRLTVYDLQEARQLIDGARAKQVAA